MQQYIPIKPKKALNFVSPISSGFNLPTKKNNANTYITRMQLLRVRQDVLSWRESIGEAENAWIPHRVKMQQLYIDTVLNGHVESCMNRRKDLTLMKDFSLGIGENKDDYWTDIFKGEWFYELLNYILDAQFYGYSLVNWTGVESDQPSGMQLIQRHHISPDRLNITPFPYAVQGKEFMEGNLEPWTLYIPTPTENGISPCGYGILYKVAYYEIFLRNLMGYNGDFVELYSQPYRVGKTTKTVESERAEFETALRDMGSAAYALIDPEDQIEFIETSQSGTGWKGYENLEQRCEKKISKLILGHADALDSTPGKLGGDQGGKSPAQEAMMNVGSKQNRFVTYVVNDMLLPKLRRLGMSIPEDMKLTFSNDDEIVETRMRNNANNKSTLEIVEKLHTMGIPVSPEWITENTGIPIDKQAAVNQEAEELKAAAQLRGSVGGVQGIIQLQQSVSMGLTPPEAAIATLINVYKFDEAQAQAMVGKAGKPVAPPLSKDVQNKLKNIYRRVK